MSEDTPSAIDEVPVETDDRAPTSPGAIKSAVTDGTRDGSLALLAGGAALLSAARSAARGRFRAIFQLTLGAALVKIGLRQRRAADETVDERVLGGEPLDTDDGADGEPDGEKATSDEAHAAVHDDEPGRESAFDDRETAAAGTEFDASTDVTFTDDDEPRSKPADDADAGDPRRNADDEEIEVDISEAAMADEASEATGPDPEQSQPTRTEATEPGPAVEEDASNGRVDPSDVGEGERDDEGDEGGEAADERDGEPADERSGEAADDESGDDQGDR